MDTINEDWLSDVVFNEDGLVPVIAQDHVTKRILMFAYMNREALIETAKAEKAIYWSRSRQQLWRKGESSGHEQLVKEIQLDCDGDVLTLMVEQIGGIACHTGRNSCFYKQLTPEGWMDAEPVLKDPSEIYADG
ncbi:MAG: phosphoribosyl-AMP cyclohydrolase [Pseudomonadales bacterium]|nr:phosphoribosyl-AMP cyclohydrolase [Pseudomonadales bacterium]